MKLTFSWNPHKSRINLSKHGISFEEAQTVFYDDLARLIPDPDHSDSEERFILLGMSSHLRIILVCHCYRENDEVIRIISARRASRTEKQLYTDGLV